MEDEITKSSGNVFADLGMDNPEERLAKSKLAHEIYKIIRNEKLPQAKAAKIMNIDQPKVSAIIRGKLSGFSLERLLHYLLLLGNDIEINIKPHESEDKREPFIMVHGLVTA